MTLPQTAGDRNPTQVYLQELVFHAGADAAMRWIDDLSHQRDYDDVEFHSRVMLQKHMGQGKWVTLRAIAMTLTLDDIMMGRWQAPKIPSVKDVLR